MAHKNEVIIHGKHVGKFKTQQRLVENNTAATWPTPSSHKRKGTDIDQQ